MGGKNSPYGEKVSNDVWTNFAPRLGLAWDPTGEGKTAVWMGYGMFYDATLFGTYEQNIFTDPPTVASVNYSNANFSNVTAGTAGSVLWASLATSVLSASREARFRITRRIHSNGDMGARTPDDGHDESSPGLRQAPWVRTSSASWTSIRCTRVSSYSARTAQPNGSTIFRVDRPGAASMQFAPIGEASVPSTPSELRIRLQPQLDAIANAQEFPHPGANLHTWSRDEHKGVTSRRTTPQNTFSWGSRTGSCARRSAPGLHHELRLRRSPSSRMAKAFHEELRFTVGNSRNPFDKPHSQPTTLALRVLTPPASAYWWQQP